MQKIKYITLLMQKPALLEMKTIAIMVLFLII